jgi:SAM-dependent methyltransferase
MNGRRQQPGEGDHNLMSAVLPRTSASHRARGCRAAPGYAESTLATLPPDAVAGAAGCGDPVGRCELRRGDIVVVLGSGVGIDLVLAARRLGSSGRVIGVDPLFEMVTAARATLDVCGVGNVEVRRARIEALPMPAASVDWVVANCVINLSHDKGRVFSEIVRVLKPGARTQITDVFRHGLPADLGAVVPSASCVAGATPEFEYIVGLTEAGLVDVAVGGRYVYDRSELAVMLTAVPPEPAPRYQATDVAAKLVGGVWRAYISARKPARKPRPLHLRIEVNGDQLTARERNKT